ncbi:hypothetical protein [Streptomyces sp. NPDC048295]|uniref:hypothetical protein n=1 Tax=Streptomyces sp. NPDC048295 TaxID=3154617 RepID=UPI00344A17D6
MCPVVCPVRAAGLTLDRAPDDRPEQTFPVVRTYLDPAVVESHEADDAEAGGLRPAEAGPPGLAAAGQRAHRLLERFARCR